MAEPGVFFEGVWKKFRRGEVHDSLRDLVPAFARRLLGRNTSVAAPAEWTAAYAPEAVDWIDSAYLTSTAQVNRLMTLCAVLDDSMCGIG